MPLVNAYCSVNQLRDQLGDAQANLPVTLLERAIQASTDAINDYTGGRQFWLDAGVTERTYIASAATYARVDDIGSRTGLIVKVGSDGRTFPTTLTAGVDFILEPRNADKFNTSTFAPFSFTTIRLIGGRVFIGGGYLGPNLSVTARYGWSGIPSKVEEACIIKAASLFKRKDAPFGVAGFNQFGEVRITRSDPDVMDLLASYVHGWGAA